MFVISWSVYWMPCHYTTDPYVTVKRTEVVPIGPFFFSRHFTDQSEERPLGRKDLYSRYVSAGPRAWVIYGSRMRRHYVMAPPLSEHYKYPSLQGSRIHSRSGVHRTDISQE